MNWQEVLTILVPIIAYMGWVYARIEKKADIRQATSEKRFDALEKRFDKVDEKLQSLDTRLTRLEGRFDERGYWESRKGTGTEGQ